MSPRAGTSPDRDRDLPDALYESSRPRWRIALGAVVVLLIAGVVGAVIASIVAPRGGAVTASIAPSPSGADEVLTVVVHVLGAVDAPGLYRLPEGARVVDAVAAAGGLSAAADPGGLNLARVLVDAEQLVVPIVGAAPAAQEVGTAPDGRIDLNRADTDLLETLPRVGPTMAARIVAWREANGGFRTVEDLREISGIGERTFAELVDLVTV